MTKQRRQFDPSLKLEVARMIKEQGLSVVHVSQSMGIGRLRYVAGSRSMSLMSVASLASENRSLPSSRKSSNWSGRIVNCAAMWMS